MSALRMCCVSALALATVLLCVHSGDAILCSQCDSGEGGWECLMQPPTPQPCPAPFSHCITVAQYHTQGKLSSLTRSCSPVDFGASCMDGVDIRTQKPTTVCTRTCSRDGCNADHSAAFLLSLTRK